jgi:hypothetical protein
MSGILSDDEILRLKQKNVGRGIYNDMLSEFLAMGEKGVDVRVQWPDNMWSNNKDDEGNPVAKTGSTLKQGFENARQSKKAPEGSDYVDVIADGEKVYLINKLATGEAHASASEPAEEPAAV